MQTLTTSQVNMTFIWGATDAPWLRVGLTPVQTAYAVLAVSVFLWLIVQARIPVMYNVRNLVVRWKTTVMTGLAFTLVVALLVVMAAFVNGMYDLTENSGQPGNVIILSEGTTDESFSNLGFSDVGDIENQPGVERLDGVPMCSHETYIVVNQPIENPQPGRPKRRFLQLRGIDDPVISSQVHGLELKPGGEWFSSAGVRAVPGSDPASAPAIEVVVGEGIAEELAQDRSDAENATARDPDRLLVGDFFRLGERIYFVVGIMQSSGSTFGSEVWAKRSVVGPMFGKGTYTSLVLRARDADGALELKRFFNVDFTKAAVAALTETEYFSTLQETNKQFLYGVVFITLILAVGGMFGVMNTMFAAISQRVKDIGVLRLLGFARWQILVCFMMESLLLALLGGGIGCALGALVDGVSATSVVSSGQGGGGKFVVLQMTVDSTTILMAMALSLAMGFVGGLIPALSAVRLRPLDALR